jgi:NAD(P)-dependent dehydrogenase (short-subunit alcohol dehydrogenase family)
MGYGCTAHFVSANLVHLDKYSLAVQATGTHFGSLDILVNAAVYAGQGSIWDTASEVYDEIMAINTWWALFFLSQYAICLMTPPGEGGAAPGGSADAAGGSIVNISSSNALYGSMPMLAPYAISKGALHVLTQNVAYACHHAESNTGQCVCHWVYGHSRRRCNPTTLSFEWWQRR